MEKAQKPQIITGVPQDPDSKLMVQKSTPLYALWRSDLSLADLKILDTYLARINSHDPTHRTVHLEKGQIEKLLGVKKINAQDLKARVRHLCTAVAVDDPTRTKAFRMISLFEEADCAQDEDGLWQIDLTCSAPARKYIFNVEHLGYLRYALRSVAHLKSRYSYILFLYLERNRHMHTTWEIGFEELKNLLCCEKEETYREFYRFNDRLLKRCHKELTEKTECQFTYQPVKRGRKVVGVRFSLRTAASQLEGQMSFDGMEAPPGAGPEKAGQYSSEALAYLAEACGYEFSEEQVQVLFDLILRLLPHDRQNGLERFHYLRQKYNLMLMYSTKDKISNRFNYLKTAIEKDLLKGGAF